MSGAILYWPAKNPAEVLDYSLDWSTWLETGDTIASLSATATTGLTLASPTKDATTTTVWLSGGTAGLIYTVTHTVTTTGGRTGVAVVKIPVK